MTILSFFTHLHVDLKHDVLSSVHETRYILNNLMLVFYATMVHCILFLNFTSAFIVIDWKRTASTGFKSVNLSITHYRSMHQCTSIFMHDSSIREASRVKNDDKSTRLHVSSQKSCVCVSVWDLLMSKKSKQSPKRHLLPSVTIVIMLTFGTEAKRKVPSPGVPHSVPWHPHTAQKNVYLTSFPEMLIYRQLFSIFLQFLSLWLITVIHNISICCMYSCFTVPLHWNAVFKKLTMEEYH